MDVFKQLETFVSVVNMGSLSAAARTEGVVPAIIGRRMDSLEDRLGVKLLVRTTRNITLTKEGSAFYEDCQRILHDVREAESLVASGTVNASGHLTLLAPATFGRRYIVPHIADFQKRHPEIRITLDLSDRLVDLAKERIDCAIRIAEVDNPSLVAVRLAQIRRVVVASPAYVARHGMPATPADLEHHDCLTLIGDSQVRGWTFKVNDRQVNQKVRSILECNEGSVLYEWVHQGLGIAWRPFWEVKDDLATGRLVRVLESYAAADDPVYAVVNQRKFMPTRVRLFIEHLRVCYAKKGYWD